MVRTGRPRRDVDPDWGTFPALGPGFDERLREWMDETDCTERQLSEVLGVGIRTVRRWKSGESSPREGPTGRIQALRRGGPDAVIGVVMRSFGK